METPIITSVTYNEFVTLINSNSLESGLQYEINDYRTRHYIVAPLTVSTNMRFTGVTNEIIGDLEPLIVTATSDHTIDVHASSEKFPQDEIYYDWNPNNWLNDLSFSDAESTASVIISGFTGVITFRYDTLLDNYLGYDFRNVKFRRWETQTSNWDISTNYNKFDIVNYNNIVYKALRNGIGQQPNLNSFYWTQLLNLNTYKYWNVSPISSNNVPSGTGYTDFYTFAEVFTGVTYENTCKSNHFDSFKDNYIISDGTSTMLSNNVFFLGIFNTLTVYSNKFFPEFSFNTICLFFFYNTIGTYFNYNIIGQNFAGNTVNNVCNNNIILNNFIFNTVNNHFMFNIVANNCSNNNFGNNITFNIIGSSSIHNNIGTHFSNNIVASGLSHNTTSSEFVDNDLGTNFSFNHVANKFSGNTIGSRFTSNMIGNDFSLNVIGNDFHDNSVSNKFTNNGIANNFYYNTIGNDFSFNTNIQNNFRYNFGSCDHLNFLLSTHVYHDHTTNFFKNELGYMKLNYIDAINTPIVVDANS